MPKMFVNNSGSIEQATKVFVNDGGVIRQATKIFVRNGSDIEQIFSSTTPTPAAATWLVELSMSSSFDAGVTSVIRAAGDFFAGSFSDTTGSSDVTIDTRDDNPPLDTEHWDLWENRTRTDPNTSVDYSTWSDWDEKWLRIDTRDSTKETALELLDAGDYLRVRFGSDNTNQAHFRILQADSDSSFVERRWQLQLANSNGTPPTSGAITVRERQPAATGNLNGLSVVILTSTSQITAGATFTHNSTSHTVSSVGVSNSLNITPALTADIAEGTNITFSTELAEYSLTAGSDTVSASFSLNDTATDALNQIRDDIASNAGFSGWTVSAEAASRVAFNGSTLQHSVGTRQTTGTNPVWDIKDAANVSTAGSVSYTSYDDLVGNFLAIRRSTVAASNFTDMRDGDFVELVNQSDTSNDVTLFISNVTTDSTHTYLEIGAIGDSNGSVINSGSINIAVMLFTTVPTLIMDTGSTTEPNPLTFTITPNSGNSHGISYENARLPRS